MTTSSKALLSLAIVGAIFGTLAFFNFTPFRTIVQNVVAGSPTGSTFGTAKTAAITMSLLTSTSTSILNTDGSMRLVTGMRVGCTGVGASVTPYTGATFNKLTVTVGTSSVANTAAPASTAFSPFAEVGAPTIATTTADFLLASSTNQTATSSQPLEWPSNSYMVFVTNATNTATCTLGIDYLGS